LEEKFSAPPFGATVDVVQVLLAALFKAGRVEGIYQGGRVGNPKDVRLEKIFGTLPGFRATAFAPQREVDLDMRARVARRLQELTGEPPSIAADQLAARIRETFQADREIFTQVIASLQALGLAVPEALGRARATIDGFATNADQDVIKSCDETWADLKDGRALAHKWNQTLTEEGIQVLRSGQELLRSGVERLGLAAEGELARLKEFLLSAHLVDHIGAVRSLVTELRSAGERRWNEAAASLRSAVNGALDMLQARYADKVESAVLNEALRPIRDMLPVEEATFGHGPNVETLLSREAALEGRANQIESQLVQLASTVEVRHVRIRELYDGVITSEDELNALLERIRRAAEEILAQGKHFLLR
jgi:hypothetical protein